MFVSSLILVRVIVMVVDIVMFLARRHAARFFCRCLCPENYTPSMYSFARSMRRQATALDSSFVGWCVSLGRGTLHGLLPSFPLRSSALRLLATDDTHTLSTSSFRRATLYVAVDRTSAVKPQPVGLGLRRFRTSRARSLARERRSKRAELWAELAWFRLV